MLAKLQLSIEHAKWLEAVRKIPCELAAEMGVVSRGENLAFEYRQNGISSFLKVRREILEADQVTKTFWIEPKGSARCFWNEDCLNARSASETLVVTEGEFDALSFLASGATSVVSVPNGSAGKPGEGDIVPSEDRQFAYLWQDGKLKSALARFRKIILATDDDTPGRILRDELAVRLGRPRCWYLEYPAGCKDANEVLQRRGADALQDMIAHAKPMVPNQLVSFSEIRSRADAKRYSSGWEKLNEHFQLVPPQLIVVTGKPNAGKSQWTIALVANLARLHGLKGAILQFEDNPDRNRRDLIRYAKAWHNQALNPIKEDPVVWVDRMFRTISPNEGVDDERDFDLDWLKGAIEEAAGRHGCRWVVIDPWNEVEHLWGRQDTEATYLNRALKYLKRLARRFQIAIFVVCHPTKDGGKNASLQDVSLYDINGGAVWANKADLGVIIWADDVNTTIRSVKIAKSKNFSIMGRPGIVTMQFDPVAVQYTCL
jgi:twinkle protein